MAPSAKKSKSSIDGINAKINLVVNSGKYKLGYKSTLRTLRDGSSQVVLVANNCPPLQKSEIEYYAMLAQANVHYYAGNNAALGAVCGKFFRVSCLSVTDAGDSDIAAAINE